MDAPRASDFVYRAKALGYKVFENERHPCNLNVVGWRDRGAEVDAFSCWLSVYWKELGRWCELSWPITTYPGKFWLTRSITKGVAILVPGQYVGAYKLGEYKFYRALKQVRPIKVYRDHNKDSVFNMDSATIESGLFGVHIHKAGWLSTFVGQNSAGCQVFKKSQDFEEFINLCEQAEFFWGNSFTYTLMEL